MADGSSLPHILFWVFSPGFRAFSIETEAKTQKAVLGCCSGTQASYGTLRRTMMVLVTVIVIATSVAIVVRSVVDMVTV